MNTFILLGPPGAGKGTQADLISADLGIPKISTGDMLRSAVASKSDLGNRVEDILNSGKLVSDDIIIELINDRINQSDCKSGYLFDGVPRTLGQANLFLQNDIGINKVIDISLDDELIIKRMSGRRFHIASGRSYHIEFNPPKSEGLDDETGEPLIQREDDFPETVKKRLEVYHSQTKPLTDFYKSKASQGIISFISINGNQSVDEVFSEIKSYL